MLFIRSFKLLQLVKHTSPIGFIQNVFVENIEGGATQHYQHHDMFSNAVSTDYVHDKCCRQARASGDNHER